MGTDHKWTERMQKAYEELLAAPLAPEVAKRRLVLAKGGDPKCPKCDSPPRFVEMTARVRCSLEDTDEGTVLGKTDHVGKRIGPMTFICGGGHDWGDPNTHAEGRPDDSTVFETLSYLAWCLRCLFEGDFKKKLEAYGIANLGWDASYARYMSTDVWLSIKKRGVLETFQAYITDEELCKAISHAVNIK